jgi:hypothetical protein
MATTRSRRSQLLFAKGKFPDGSEAYVIVDLGAGATVVSKEFLPAGVEVSELVAVEYTGDGERETSGKMEGAGGEVSGFLGKATIPSLQVGDLLFESPEISVIDELPRFFDREVGAILGLDLLQGGVVALGYGYGDGGNGYMELTSKGRSGAPAMEVPFSIAANHIFIDGSINGMATSLMLDTGARASIAFESTAREAELHIVDSEVRELRGLDGQPIHTRLGTAETLALGEHSFPAVDFYVADLAGLAHMGLTQDTGGVIGNDFLRQFSRIEVDFNRKMIRLFD